MNQAKLEHKRYKEQDDEIATEEEKIQQLADLLKEMLADKTILSEFIKQTGVSFDKVIT